jgi:serine/threonine-protein kinase
MGNGPDTAEQPHRNPETSSGTWDVPARDLTGRTLGDYQIERLLGRGGMGEVYLARQISLDRPVALKVLKPELAGNPAYMARFESEAWTAAKLNHPNIVHMYALGGEEGLKYIAMEYVAGITVRDYIARKGLPELPLALSIMKQAGQAVQAAGEAGLIHRDIKPENLLLTRKGQVKVADFGLCRRPDADSVKMTQHGTTLGTPMYMSPEQVRGQPHDHRSDLYSLGVTFYHILAGEPPFQAETPVAIALKHIHEPPVSLSVHRPDLPPALVDLVMRLIEKLPENRYQSAAEMLKDLARIRSDAATALAMRLEPASEEPRSALSTASRASGMTVAEPLEAPARSKAITRRFPARRVPGWVWLVLGAAAAGGGALLGWQGRMTTRLAPSSALQSMPALWLEPWREAVPAFETALEQYRYAQTRADPRLRPAAWLAVAGRFPGSTRLVLRAYTQYIRDLLRLGDGARLEDLARAMLDRRGHSDREEWQSLSRIARAAAAALEHDPSAVLEQFLQLPNLELLDPSLAEIGIQIVDQARADPARAPEHGARLAQVHAALLGCLRLEAPGRLAAGVSAGR